MSKGLGRFPFLQAEDANHLMRSVLQMERLTIPRNHVWRHGDILDQGNEGACVGFGHTAWENARPVGDTVQQGYSFAYKWYKDAQAIDPWAGDDYEGTTVRAGMRVALRRGYIERYLWAGSKEEIDAWLLTRGPIVVGSNWYNSMDNVGPKGWMRVDPNSGNRGGHCYLLLGRRWGNYVFQNSWGEGYADDGMFYMNTENFIKLVQYGNSEFCTALQTKAA